MNEAEKKAWTESVTAMLHAMPDEALRADRDTKKGTDQ